MIARGVYVLLLVAVLSTVEMVQAANMDAWLDRTRIAEGETVQLTLEAQGQVSGRPDTVPLEKDFDVLGISTGSRMRIVNGRTDARTTWTLTLSPRGSGILTIPTLQVGDHRSPALTLEVGKAPAPAPGSSADILLETEIAPRAPYVQGQILYTIRLLHAVPIASGQLAEPEPPHTLVQRLGEDRDFVTTRNGRRYQVIERRYALFPQTSGAFELPGPVFDGELPDRSRRRSSPFKGFFGSDPFFGRDPFDDLIMATRRVRVRGEPAEVDVRPRPEVAQGRHWLPAEHLALSGQWQPDATEVRVGEPVTWVVQLEAKGLTGGQLPSLAPNAVAGFDVFPDQAQRQTDAGDAGVIGLLEQKIAFIPRRPGELALPAIDVSWWDTQADRERVATLPGRVLKVAPAVGQTLPATDGRVPDLSARDAAQDPGASPVATSNSAPVLPPPSGAPSPGSWPWITSALVVAWSLTLVLWWWHVRQVGRRAPKPPASASKSVRATTARKRFLAACQADDAISARRALLAWAEAHWPSCPPRGLDALAQRLPDPQLREMLTELDRALYQPGGAWNGGRLASHLQRLPKQEVLEDKAETTLAPLYPNAKRRLI